MAAQDRMLESMGVFGVIARWIVQAHEAHSFEKVLRENIRNTIRNEAGAVAFGYGQLLGTCSGGRALAQFPGGSEFALIECFEREADFTAHVETQHFKIFRERISAFFLGDRAVTIKGYGRLRFDKLRSLDVVA
jgi:quinol monooxygenase YgiN